MDLVNLGGIWNFLFLFFSILHKIFKLKLKIITLNLLLTFEQVKNISYLQTMELSNQNKI